MGYLNGLIDAYFIKRDEATFVYFPYGLFGPGYIISKDDKKRIERFEKRFFTTFFLIFILITFFSYFYVDIVIPYLLLFMSIGLLITHQLLKNKKKSIEKFTLKDRMKNMACSIGRGTSFLFFLLGLLLIGWFAFL